MRHETRGNRAAAGNRAGNEETRLRYVERRGARQACSNLTIDTAVRRREYFRFDAGRAVGRAADPSRSPHSSTCAPVVRLAENSLGGVVRSPIRSMVFPWEN